MEDIVLLKHVKFKHPALLDDPKIEKFWNFRTKHLSEKTKIKFNNDPNNQYLLDTKNYLNTTNTIITQLDRFPLNNKVDEYLSKLPVSKTMTYLEYGVESDTYSLHKTKLEKLWKIWFDLSVVLYNASLAILRENPNMTKYSVRDAIKEAFIDRIDGSNIPNTSVEYSCFDAFNAFEMSRSASNRTIDQSSMSIGLDGRSIKDGYIYSTKIKKFLKTRYTKHVSDIYKNVRISTIANVNTSRICRLVWNTLINKFYLAVPRDAVDKPDPIRNFIALDPGVRTFMSFYDGESFGEIGKNISSQLYRLNLVCDSIQSKRDTAKSNRRRKLDKALNRTRQKIKSIVNDLHYKTRIFLRKYKYIILPDFKVKSILKNDLPNHTKRALQDLSHFKFRLRVASESSENSKLIICNESYTSKTCSCCGFIDRNLGCKKTYRCRECPNVMDRDINAARNIFLRVVSKCRL
jgi:putative transposase